MFTNMRKSYIRKKKPHIVTFVFRYVSCYKFTGCQILIFAVNSPFVEYFEYLQALGLTNKIFKDGTLGYLMGIICSSPTPYCQKNNVQYKP